MSSPVITVLDYILVMLGIAPLKILVNMWMAKRARRRKQEVEQAMNVRGEN